MALVRVYCGLASADESVRAASAAQLTIAVVDDAGRLLGVHEISDDPAGYAAFGSLLVERTSGFTDAAVAADSDDHLVTSLLTAAGRPLVVADDDTTDDFAERFADDDSVEEMQAPPAARRAVGLARALQAGALGAVNLPVPRELVSYKPVLAAHVALLSGRHAAATALRETLRELYPAALRAYPDPAHPLALAVLDALPEPGRLTSHGGSSERVAEDVATELIRAGAGTEDELIAAVTALHVAISESPRRGGVNKSLAPAAAETVRQAIAAVRASDAACASLISTIASRSTPSTSGVGRRAARKSAEPTPIQSFGRRGRTEPSTAGAGPVTPHPLNTPPAAPDPIAPPPTAPRPVAPPPVVPAAAAAFPNRAPAPGNRPVSVPPPPPGMTPITPGSRPAPAPTSAPAARMTPTSAPPAAPASPAGPLTPADSGQPFRATLTNAAINNARAERQRTVIPPRPSTPARPPSTGDPSSPTDFSLPMPAQRPAETAEPGSRANWPLLNSAGDDLPAASTSSPPTDGRVKPPWQDMPKEPPALRLVESQLAANLDATVTDLPPVSDPPALRLIEGEERGGRRNGARRGGSAPAPTGTTITALERSVTPPVPADSSDGDLLIFAAARSAWFTGHTDDAPTNLEWANPNDSGWRAAEKASTPEVASETAAGLPKRVPQANLVPGAPMRDERPLRIVRDAASIAAHTTGYFRGWRRGQEIGGFAMGGRPGREAAGGWDFTRDGQPADDFRNSGAGYGGGR
ncbi:transposase [Actinoplanes sp. TBRC 11911]|uniref:transposase n=1 Tax=Actinoplanes sp. TBRC 11911 TaxID=2729386 RepID=UPI00145D0E33|nr:transposase [Actinoplanes sp. TBRC 11911]NMO50347.1 transposase [Actinoplanes sp. TBRC 11911]